MAAACFIFAGVKLSEILSGPGNYRWEEMFFFIAFVMFGMLYVFLFWREKKDQQP